MVKPVKYSPEQMKLRLSGHEYGIEEVQEHTICSSTLVKTPGQPVVYGGEGKIMIM